jgi:hypothetical protein
MFALGYKDSNDLSRFGPTILLSSRLPTISFNTSSFGRAPDERSEDAELMELQDELAALAEEPEDDLDEVDNGD